MAYSDASPPPLSLLLGSGFSETGGTDPEALKYFLDKGYVNIQGGSGDNPTWYSMNNDWLPAAANGMKYGTFGNPEAIQQTGAELLDPNAVWDDPLYGNITSEKNMYRKPDMFFESILPMLASAAFSFGLPLAAGAAGGAAGAAGAGQGMQAFNALKGFTKGTAEGQGFNPMSIAGGAAKAFGGLPEGMDSFISPVASLLQGGSQFNLMQIAMALAQRGRR